MIWRQDDPGAVLSSFLRMARESFKDKEVISRRREQAVSRVSNETSRVPNYRPRRLWRWLSPKTCVAAQLLHKGPLAILEPFLVRYVFPSNCSFFSVGDAGFEPATSSLLGRIRVFLSVAAGCKTRIPEPFSLLRFARRCRVLRSQWCQSGVNWSPSTSSRFTRSWKKLSEANHISDDHHLPPPQKTREKVP
jgi:hypothetical protein